jgi:hypothetical protein
MDVFEVDRQGEADRLDGWVHENQTKKEGVSSTCSTSSGGSGAHESVETAPRLLLWHGSRMSNFVGLLSQVIPLFLYVSFCLLSAEILRCF